MGSSSSTSKLVCPKGYDEEKFNVLTRIFRHLDFDGNRVVASQEMKKFLEVFYECEVEDLHNKIVKLRKEKISISEERAGTIKFVLDDYKCQCARHNGNDRLYRKQKEELIRLEKVNYEKINEMMLNYENEILKCQLELKLIDMLLISEKANLLVEKMLKEYPKKKEVDFKHFYLYLKGRNVLKMGSMILK